MRTRALSILLIIWFINYTRILNFGVKLHRHVPPATKVFAARTSGNITPLPKCFAPNLNATLILLDTYKTNPQNTPSIVSVASGKLGSSDLESLLRLDNLALPSDGSPFTVAYSQVNTVSGGNPNNGANISWNLTGTGFNLLGVYVFGGSQGANLYQVDSSQLISGFATVNTPLTGNFGKYATISHLLF